MLDLLDQRLRRMHAAIEALDKPDFTGIEGKRIDCPAYSSLKVDFTSGSDPIELANIIALLIANIASLKDHLKAWCKKYGVPFNGDALINKNRSVALVHDLWNLEKHVELRSKPRSGHIPKLRKIGLALAISAGTEAESVAVFTMQLGTGEISTGSSGSGSVKRVLIAEVVDENENYLGDFTTICIEAAEAWAIELSAAGVPS